MFFSYNMSSGINIGNPDYKYYSLRFNTRLREDRSGFKNPTPTNLKIPLIKIFTLPQLHPSTDIPASVAISLCSFYIGKPVIVDHDVSSMGQIGYVAFANVTDQQEHLLTPKEGDENSTYNGKLVNFKTLMGILGIFKKHVPVLEKMKNVGSFSELDCSISYEFYWDFDEEDIIYEKDDKGVKTDNIDFKESKVFATGFKPLEISIVGRMELGFTSTFLQGRNLFFERMYSAPRGDMQPI